VIREQQRHRRPVEMSDEDEDVSDLSGSQGDGTSGTMRNRGKNAKDRSGSGGSSGIASAGIFRNDNADDKSDSTKKDKKKKKGLFGMFGKKDKGELSDKEIEEMKELERQLADQKSQFDRIKNRVREKNESDHSVSSNHRNSRRQSVREHGRGDRPEQPRSRGKLKQQRRDSDSSSSVSSLDDEFGDRAHRPSRRDNGGSGSSYPATPKAYQRDELSSSMHSARSAKPHDPLWEFQQRASARNPANAYGFDKRAGDPLSNSMHGYPSASRSHAKEFVSSSMRASTTGYGSRTSGGDPLGSSSMHGYPSVNRSHARESLRETGLGGSSDYPSANKSHAREKLSSSINPSSSAYPAAARDYARERFSSDTKSGDNGNGNGAYPSPKITKEKVGRGPSTSKKSKKESSRKKEKSSSSYPSVPKNHKKESTKSKKSEKKEKKSTYQPPPPKPKPQPQVSSSSDSSSEDEAKKQQSTNKPKKKKENKPVFDPFKVLGVPGNATGDEVKKAYRKKVKESHPDKQQQHGIDVSEHAGGGEGGDATTQMFINVKKAWDLIKGDENREKWQRSLYPEFNT